MRRKYSAKDSVLPPETIFLFLIVSISLFGDSSLYVLLPIHAASIGVSVSMVGILLSTNRFVRLFTNYAVSSLHVRLGSRVMVTACIIIASLTTLVYGLPVGWFALFLSRIAWGFCWSSFRYESFNSITQNSSENYRGRASGMFYSITRIGSLAALLICGVIVEYTGYRNTFYIFSLITLVIGLIMLLLWTLSQKHAHNLVQLVDIGHVENKSNPQRVFQQTQTGKPPKSHIHIRPLFCYSLTMINGWIGSGLLITTVGYIMMLKFGQNLSILGITIGISMAASFLSSTNWFHSIFLSVVFGRLSDKYGRSRVLVIICLVHIVSLFTIAYSQWLLLYALAATVCFAATVGLNSVLTAVTLDLHCQTVNNEHVISHQTTFIDLGSALGALFGFLLVVYIGYKTTYVISSLVLAAMVIFLLYDMKLSANRSISQEELV
ncbi:MAG: MFS transporter [Bacillota bacterium]|nr:MFS transporter [Bacillota bacterium]